MRGNMMIFASLCLLLFWMLPADSQEIPLCMVESAVDDMYFGCREKMAKMLKDKYSGNKNITDFWEDWKSAGDRNVIASRIIEGFIRMFRWDKALINDHKKAVSVYTQVKGQWYRKLNVKVRSSRTDYGKDDKDDKDDKDYFPLDYFHFWLTSAIQNLNNKDAECFTSYHRSKITFHGEVKQTFRFGAFTSSSLITTLDHFGNETCFKIKTCLGASLGSHSTFPNEQEVLIPPYEMFTITEKKEGKFVEGLTDCKLVYVVETAGVHSNLNCKLSQEE